MAFTLVGTVPDDHPDFCVNPERTFLYASHSDGVYRYTYPGLVNTEGSGPWVAFAGGVSGITCGPDGDVYVATNESGNVWIYRLAPDGSTADSTGTDLDAGVVSICWSESAIGQDMTFLAEQANGNLSRVTWDAGGPELVDTVYALVANGWDPGVLAGGVSRTPDGAIWWSFNTAPADDTTYAGRWDNAGFGSAVFRFFVAAGATPFMDGLARCDGTWWINDDGVGRKFVFNPAGPNLTETVEPQMNPFVESFVSFNDDRWGYLMVAHDPADGTASIYQNRCGRRSRWAVGEVI